MNETKKLYAFDDDGCRQVLLLSDEQAAVIYWLNSIGHNFELTESDEDPYEITTEEWNNQL